jgi:hypothetical protein
MKMKFTKIPENTFKNLQMNAGIIVDAFNPATQVIGNLLGATTGGLQFQDNMEFKDFGEDIDNCPKNMLELKKLDSHDVSVTGTFVTMSADTAKLLAGPADKDPSDATHIIPRNDLLVTDFKDIWMIGDYSDKNTGDNAGFLAIHLINALNTGGFQIQTQDKEKGQFAFTFTGHYSMEAQDVVPYEIYIKEGTEPAPTPTPELTDLSIGALTLTPEFSTAVTEYTATTTNATNTITATVSGGGTATIEVNNTEIENGGTATWEEGANIVEVTVGSTTYTVTVTKE